MRSELEITQRINTLGEKVESLVKKWNEEMEKPFAHRDNRLLVFISVECKIYDYCLSQLRWVYEKEGI